MHARIHLAPGIALALVLASGVAAVPADQTPTAAEAELATPAPEPPSGAAAEAATPTAIPASPAPPPLSSQPIEAVHRPRGLAAPFAIAADLFVMRPLGLLSLFAGAATTTLVAPVAAATCTLGDRVDTLHDRAKNVFTRPLGAF